MTTLAKNTPRAYDLGEVNELPVIASDIIYEGAAVGDNASGYARPLVSGDPFRGFALAQADNSDGSAGDVNVRVQMRGKVVLTFSSIAITDVGKDVYASDDNSFNIAATGTRIGYVHRWISSTQAVVAFEQAHGYQADLDVSALGASAASALMMAINGSMLNEGVATEINANFFELATDINNLKKRLGN